MSNENPQERPNYILHYRAQFRDDWLESDYLFNAPDDNLAREMSSSFVIEHNERDRQEIDQGKKSWQDWCKYELLKLERIEYVIEEVEKRRRVSLQGDVTSRVRSGSPVELSELTNL